MWLKRSGARRNHAQRRPLSIVEPDLAFHCRTQTRSWASPRRPPARRECGPKRFSPSGDCSRSIRTSTAITGRMSRAEVDFPVVHVGDGPARAPRAGAGGETNRGSRASSRRTGSIESRRWCPAARGPGLSSTVFAPPLSRVAGEAHHHRRVSDRPHADAVANRRGLEAAHLEDQSWLHARGFSVCVAFRKATYSRPVMPRG